MQEMDVDPLEALWPSNHDVIQCNRFMLERKLAFDVWFQVGPPETSRRIGAHKYVLSARSYRFYLMFNGPNAVDAQGDIRVQGVSPDCFEELLCYIYCDETHFNPPIENACNLQKAAEKYNIQGLVGKCRIYMKTVLDTEQFWQIYENALVCDDADMKGICKQTLLCNAWTVFESQEFLNISRNCLEDILSFDDINMPEKDIFECVLKWAGRECTRKNLNPNCDKDIRRALTWRILKNIRFSHMDQDYFTNKISNREILTENEKLYIFMFVSSNRTIAPFHARKRRIVFNRFRCTLTGKSYVRRHADTIDFNISRDLTLQEILIFGSCQKAGNYEIDLQVKDGSTSLYKMHDLEKVETDGKIKIYPITLQAPVPICKGVTYTVSMIIKGPDSYYGEEGITPLTSKDVTINFFPNTTGLNGTSDKFGQFAGFVFGENASLNIMQMDVDFEAEWPCNEDAMQCHRYMLQNKRAFDVWFAVGPPENMRRIGAHKYMLSARSYTFYLMFNGPNQDNGQGDISVQDITPDCFDDLLRYIYCDNVEVEPKDALHLLKAAEKFGIQGLITKCQQECMSVENVCDVLQSALEDKNQSLKMECFKYISYDTENVLKSDGFLRLSHAGMVELLHEHKLNLSEEIIFDYVVEWAKKACDRRNIPQTPENLRRELNRAVLDNINFAHMRPESFEEVSRMKILTDHECVEIMSFFLRNTAVSHEIPHLRSVVFNRFKKHLSGKGYFRGNADRIVFTVSEPLKLHEVFIYGSSQNPGRYEIDMKIIDDSETVLHRSKVVAETDGYTKVYHVAVKPPVPVQKDKKYTLCMIMRGPISFYGNDASTQLISDGVTMELFY